MLAGVEPEAALVCVSGMAARAVDGEDGPDVPIEVDPAVAGVLGNPIGSAPEQRGESEKAEDEGSIRHAY
jgi:hypothetical protein